MNRDLAALLRLLWRYRARYALGALALTVADSGQLVAAHLIGRAVDVLAAGARSATAIRPYVLGMIATALLVALARYVWRQYVFGTSRMIERGLRQRLFDHLSTLSARFYMEHKTGELMAYATNDVPAIQAAAAGGMMALLDAVIVFVGASFAMVTTVSWQLSIVALLPLLLLTPGTYWLGKRLHVRYGEVQKAFSVLSDRAQENAAGIRVVKGFAIEDQQIQHFDAAIREYRQSYARMVRYDAAFDPLINVLAGTSFALGILYGGWLVVTGPVSVGSYVAFNSYLAMLVWPMLALGWVMNLFQRATASLARLQSLFDVAPEVADAPDARPLRRPEGRISIRGLTFRYRPELPPALQDLDLEVPPGATVGIVGRTGCGKSTIAMLLTRVFDPPPGTVFVDGIDVRELRLADLRRAVAIVPQDAFLFSRELRANINFAGRDPDDQPVPDAAVEQAARIADIAGEIESLPQGYATVVGERGITLSGGQRQRVCLARALVRDAPILILDDCLSAVDTITEAEILSALRTYTAGRTTLIMTHRVSALREAQEIIVLDDGRVVERGTHDELVALEGEYARLWRKQQLETALADLSHPVDVAP